MYSSNCCSDKSHLFREMFRRPVLCFTSFPLVPQANLSLISTQASELLEVAPHPVTLSVAKSQAQHMEDCDHPQGNVVARVVRPKKPASSGHSVHEPHLCTADFSST